MKKSGAQRLKESKERKREQVRERVKRFRERKREEKLEELRGSPDENEESAFSNRVAKKRAVDKVKEALPVTPEKRIEVVLSVLNSPTVYDALVRNGTICSLEQRRKLELYDAVVKDAGSLISEVKEGRTNDSRAAVQMGLSLLCGNTVNEKRLQSAVSRTLGINRRRISRSASHRVQVTNDKSVGWSLVSRKKRNDAISEEHIKLAYDYWAGPGVSRPTGNKKDIARERIRPNEYCEHEKQILEKTQNEVYIEFKRKYPEVKMCQRSFENCRPFFVVPARPADRNSCCCRSHVEMRMLFTECMKFRKTVLIQQPDKQRHFPVYEHLNDLISSTLCPKSDGANYYARECCDRECETCGVHLFKLLEEEKNNDESGVNVTWQRFEYVTTNEKRRLQLVVKCTPPGEMFDYFKNLLVKFPSHQRRAKWQHDQMKCLIENLPFGHVCCVHDYSENYACQQQDQPQSMYFSQIQASIHVTVLHRHPLKEIDGENRSGIVTEHLFVISPDLKHDHHSVQHCRMLVAQYLQSINYDVKFLHEWTDGCSAQYKSRHCMGDVSYSVADLGYPTIRNYFETSHAKGPQDGAGANLKSKADMAVIRRQQVIQNAHDLYTFAQGNMLTPVSGGSLSRRVFFYVEASDRNRPRRHFKEIKGNRAIHSILARGQGGQLEVRDLSCYCDNCINENYEQCVNTAHVKKWENQVLEVENTNRRATRADVTDFRESIVDLVSKNSTVAIASGDASDDYYLLKVISEQPEILQNPVKDDWGARYPAGAKVLRGNFYERVNCSSVPQNVLFKLVSGKIAYVYAATVRFICSDLQECFVDGSKLFKLFESEHLDILDSLDGF